MISFVCNIFVNEILRSLALFKWPSLFQVIKINGAAVHSTDRTTINIYQYFLLNASIL
jgi:hypothetical protein